MTDPGTEGAPPVASAPRERKFIFRRPPEALPVIPAGGIVVNHEATGARTRERSMLATIARLLKYNRPPIQVIRGLARRTQSGQESGERIKPTKFDRIINDKENAEAEAIPEELKTTIKAEVEKAVKAFDDEDVNQQFALRLPDGSERKGIDQLTSFAYSANRLGIAVERERALRLSYGEKNWIGEHPRPSTEAEIKTWEASKKEFLIGYNKKFDEERTRRKLDLHEDKNPDIALRQQQWNLQRELQLLDKIVIAADKNHTTLNPSREAIIQKMRQIGRELVDVNNKIKAKSNQNGGSQLWTSLFAVAAAGTLVYLTISRGIKEQKQQG